MLVGESLFILILMVANGIFSGSEIAVVSARKARLEQLANQGSTAAQVALRLANAPNDFLSTVQIGITLIGILSGAVAGATIAERLESFFLRVPELAPYTEGISVTIVVGIITLVSLVVGELVPKRIALNNPERIACAVAQPMWRLSRVVAPLVHLLGLSTELLLALLGVRASLEPTITEEEIKVLIRQGAKSGIFEATEQAIVERVFRLGDRSIKSLMTPRTEITWLDYNAPLAKNIETVVESTHARFPVARNDLDQCLGVIRGSRLLAAQLSSPEVDLEALI